MSKHPLPAGKGSGLPERSHAPQSPSPKEGGKRMTVTGHLREIRTRLVRSALVYLLLAVLCFFVVGRISEALMALGRRFHFVYTAPAELVTAYVKLSLVCALVLASPFLLYQIWGFVAPALKRTEKRLVFLGLCGGLVFFLLGAVFAYFVAIPFMLDFFANFDPSGAVLPMISYENYLSFVLGSLVCFGVVFEMPMLALLLSQFGILKAKTLVRFRKYAVLVIAIVAAIVTPPDVVSQIVVLIPMMLLYEISILICRAVGRRKAAKARAEETRGATVGEENEEEPED